MMKRGKHSKVAEAVTILFSLSFISAPYSSFTDMNADSVVHHIQYRAGHVSPSQEGVWKMMAFILLQLAQQPSFDVQD